jgi:hypothetical protein
MQKLRIGSNLEAYILCGVHFRVITHDISGNGPNRGGARDGVPASRVSHQLDHGQDSCWNFEHAT